MGLISVITSLDNVIIKTAVALKTKKNRDETGLFVIEGEKFTKEIPNEWYVKCFLLSDEFTEAKNIDFYLKRDAEVYSVSPAAFKKASGSVSPQIGRAHV